MFELKKPLSLTKKKAILKMQRYKRKKLHEVQLRKVAHEKNIKISKETYKKNLFLQPLEI